MLYACIIMEVRRKFAEKTRGRFLSVFEFLRPLVASDVHSHREPEDTKRIE